MVLNNVFESTERAHQLLIEVLDRKIELIINLHTLKLSSDRDTFKQAAKDQMNKFRFELVAFLEEKQFKF